MHYVTIHAIAEKQKSITICDIDKICNDARTEDSWLECDDGDINDIDRVIERDLTLNDKEYINSRLNRVMRFGASKIYLIMCTNNERSLKVYLLIDGNAYRQLESAINNIAQIILKYFKDPIIKMFGIVLLPFPRTSTLKSIKIAEHQSLDPNPFRSGAPNEGILANISKAAKHSYIEIFIAISLFLIGILLIVFEYSSKYGVASHLLELLGVIKNKADWYGNAAGRLATALLATSFITITRIFHIAVIRRAENEIVWLEHH